MSDLKHTQRGFAYIEFQDRYDHKCSIQKSSLATEDAIWFGIDDANPQVLHGDARRLGIETDATSGWVPYPLPAEVSLATRMHLTQDQVRELLPTLIHFAETGDVLAPAECRTQPEATAPAQDDLRNGLCDKSWTKIRYKGFTYSFPASMPLAQVFAETLALTDEAPAQDLSAAILTDAQIKYEWDSTHYHSDPDIGPKEIEFARACIAAALASSANALGARDGVDAPNVVKLTDEQYLQILEPVLSRYGMQRYLNGDEITLDPSDYRAIINAAILQSQKSGPCES